MFQGMFQGTGTFASQKSQSLELLGTGSCLDAQRIKSACPVPPKVLRIARYRLTQHVHSGFYA